MIYICASRVDHVLYARNKWNKYLLTVTLTTILSNILLLIKEIKTKIQTLKPIYKILMTLRVMLENLTIVLLTLLPLEHLL